jgi:DNA-binding NarL/FixJ family response regulator
MDHSLTKTILLLVPDPVVRSVLDETLKHEGYTVLAGGDLGQAVDWLKRCMPDLLITRTHIQSMPGHEAAMYLVARCPSMRVLILGGLPDDERLLNREALQGFAIFPKPYSAREMLQEVKHVLSGHREPA